MLFGVLGLCILRVLRVTPETQVSWITGTSTRFHLRKRHLSSSEMQLSIRHVLDLPTLWIYIVYVLIFV